MVNFSSKERENKSWLHSFFWRPLWQGCFIVQFLEFVEILSCCHLRNKQKNLRFVEETFKKGKGLEGLIGKDARAEKDGAKKLAVLRVSISREWKVESNRCCRQQRTIVLSSFCEIGFWVCVWEQVFLFGYLLLVLSGGVMFTLVCGLC